MNHILKEQLKGMPIITNLAGKVFRRFSFHGSREYWENRYSMGGTSGAGSYGRLAEFKAEVINTFFNENKINTALEFGCGDGNQMALIDCPSYIGLDVSKNVIKLCKERFKDDGRKSFFLYDTECFVDRCSVFKADVTLSLDVIFHLVEDVVFESYMKHLFAASRKYVIIYSSNSDENKFEAPHFKNRNFSKWIELHLSEWKLKQFIPNKYPFRGDEANESLSDFLIYEKS